MGRRPLRMPHSRRSLPFRMKPVRSVSASRPHVDWLDGPIASLDVNRRLFATLLVEHLPSVGYRMPQATYLAWLDFCGLGWGDDPAVHALDHARVGLSNGPPFGDPGRGFARLNLACSPLVSLVRFVPLASTRRVDRIGSCTRVGSHFYRLVSRTNGRA